MIPLASAHQPKKILLTSLGLLLVNTSFRLYWDYHVLKDQRNYNQFVEVQPRKTGLPFVHT